MNDPTRSPTILDGAKVVSVTTTQARFGEAVIEGNETVKIVALAIARYENSGSIYLFACDEQWRVVGDLVYDSILKAKEDAERYYESGKLEWTDVVS